MSVKSVSNKSVDNSGGSDTSGSWETAVKGAKEAGIRWERPDGDRRSAQDIIDDSPLLKNLGNQSGVKNKLEERVGDFKKDADAAFRAVQVLEHIERFDGDGNRLAGKNVDNGKVNGFTSQGHAEHDTEAGRLQDFGKYGFENLEGELQDLSTVGDDEEARAAAAEVGIVWERPEGDDRSAKDIIDDNPLLKNLGNQSGVKDMLKDRVGDFEKDADAAYRASQVLDHVVRFDGDGNRLIGKKVDNDSIDDFTTSGEAKNNKESGRLQDFGKHGFESLKGELALPDTAAGDKEARAQAEELGIEWERPEGDDRSAKDIIDDSKLLNKLGNQSGVKDMLKERVGDFEKDADAAYRAVQVLEHVERLDGEGKTLAEDSGNGSIDGFTNSGEARNGTEAGRLQDFGKFGFPHLKGELTDIGSAGDDEKAREQAEELGIEWERPEGDDRSANDIIDGNPLLSSLDEREKNQLKTRVGDFEKDADAAYRAVEVLGHIERYDGEGKPIRGSTNIGNDRLDGFASHVDGDAKHGTEAGRFKDFIEQGFGSLKRTDAGGAADIEKLEEYADLMSDSIPDEDYKHLNDFMGELQSGAYYHIIQKAGLPDDKKDMIENPDNYTAEQRGAAILELSTMSDRIVDGGDKWSDYGFVGANSHFAQRDREGQLHSDPEKVLEEIGASIDKLSNEDVEEWMGKAEAEALQDIVQSSPKLEEFASNLVDDMKNDAKWLNKALDGKDTIEGMRDYYTMASSLNLATGKDGEPKVEDLTINIKDSDQFEKITDEYEGKLADEKVLSELIEVGMTQDEALAELNSRASLFSAFGSPVDEIGANINRNISHHLLSTTTQEDLNGVVLNEDGTLDEDRLNDVIEEVRENDPESAFLQDDEGRQMTNGQIVTAARNLWDTMRGTLKWNHTLAKSGENFLSKDNSLTKAYGVGAMHFMSSFLAGGAMVAKAEDGVQSDAEIAGIIGGSMQMIGGFGEGTMLLGRDNLGATRKVWNSVLPSKLSPGDATAKEQIGNAMDKLRTISATGGVFVLGASIALGIEEAKKGNGAGAAAYFAGGISQAATAPFAYTQALSRMVGPWYFNTVKGLPLASTVELLNEMPFAENIKTAEAASNRLYTRAALFAGRVMTFMNPVALLAAIGYAIYDGVKGDQKTDAYFDSFAPTLADYDIDGGGETDPWYDEEHSTGTS